MDRLKQELELAESCRSPEYRRCIRFMDFLFGLLSIRLSSSKRSKSQLLDNRDVIYNRVRVAIIDGNERGSSSSIWRFRLARLIYSGLIMYGLVKFVIVLVLQFGQEQLIGRLMPESCLIISVPQCCLARDIPAKLERYQARFDRISYWIDTIGYPMANIPIIAPLLICVVAVFIVTAYPVTLTLVYLSDVHLDIMGFVENPVAMARRYYGELERLTSDFSDSFLNKSGRRRCTCGLKSANHRFSVAPVGVAATRNSRLGVKLMGDLYQALDYKQLAPTSSVKKCANAINPKKLLRMLPQIGRTIRPASLDTAWHRNLVTWIYLGTRGLAVCFCCFALCFYLTFTYIVIKWSFSRLVETVQCASLGANVRPVNYVHLKPLNVTRYESLFSEYAATVAQGQTEPGFSIILRYFFNWARVVMFVEIGIALVLLTIWFGSIICFFVLAVADKIRWIKQVQSQLLEVISEQSKPKVDHDRLLELSLTAYFNYALFKSEYSKFRPLVNIVLAQVLIFTTCSLLSLYIASDKNFKLDSASLAFINAALIILLGISNAVFALGSHMFAETEHTIKQLIRILALYNTLAPPQDADTHLSLDFIMSCWHRHLLDREALAKAYALSFFGIKVCFEKLLPMNAYSLGVGLMMLRY